MMTNFESTSGAWPAPASFVHFLLPIDARLPVPDGTSFEFYGPTDPPFDDIQDVPHEQLANEPGVVCGIVFAHFSVPIERLMLDSMTLVSVIDTASHAGRRRSRWETHYRTRFQVWTLTRSPSLK